MKVLSLCVLLVAIGLPASVRAQTCVPRDPNHPLTKNYRIVAEGTMVSYSTQLKAAVDDVNRALGLTRNPYRLLNSGNGHVIKVRFASISTPTWENGVIDWSGSVIKINQNAVFAYQGLLEKTLRHELLHLVGLGHTSASSIMQQPFDPAVNQAFPTTLTASDKCGLRTAYGATGTGGDDDEDAGRGGRCDPTGSPSPGDPCSPIIFHFGPGVLALTEPTVAFDIAGSGQKRLFSWTKRDADDGFLFLDRDLNGAVSDGRELFGDATPLAWDMRGPRASHGFEAMEWFDRPANGGNGDGKISAADQVYAYLLLWFDYNHDGRSQPVEFASLAERGVRAISVTPSFSRRRDRHGNLFLFKARYEFQTPAGQIRERWVFDVFLVSKELQ